MKTQPLQKELISKNEAAFMLGFDADKIKTLCEVGLLTCRSNGKAHLILAKEVRELLDNVFSKKNANWCRDNHQKAVLIEFFYQPIKSEVINEYSRT